MRRMSSIAIIDRFKGDADCGAAVIEYTWPDGDITMIVAPRAILPPEAREGDVLTITVTVDEEATAQRRCRAEELQARLTEGRP